MDDHRNFLDTTMDLLTEMGYRCTGVLSGDEALETVREMHFDLILLDIKMPGINGVDTFKKMKMTPPPHAPVVMMTAYKEDSLIREAVEEGVLAVLKKPLDMGQLSELLETMDPNRLWEEKTLGKKDENTAGR